MQGKQVETTKIMKHWVSLFNDPKLVNSLSTVLGATPLTVFKTPFYDCHWFDFNNIRREINQEVASQKFSPLTNVNSTFYVPYSHNIFVFDRFCCYVSTTEKGLDFQYIKLGEFSSVHDIKLVSFSLCVDDVAPLTLSKLREGIIDNTGSKPSKISAGAIDYSKVYRFDIDSVMGISQAEISQFKEIHGKDTRLRTDYKLGLLSAIGFPLRVLRDGKYQQMHFLSDETEYVHGKDIPDEAKRLFTIKAREVLKEAVHVASVVYNGLNLIHKHNTQVPVLTTTKDSVFKSKRRNRRGIKPLIEWRTYEYDISKPVLKLNKKTGYRGTHASPREHERRGHWRSLQSGKRTWVKPSKIGDKSMGEIHKNFVVTSTSSIGQSQNS